ncbi:MAG TPA: hypothetical protein VN886_21545 [Acidimicrobiales bacterium]|nr:hypothetical protein [Acidimicrobiales bacterium]
MTATEERVLTDLGAYRQDYHEIYVALRAHGGWDLSNKFENLACELAHECTARAVAAAWGGAVINGTVVIGGVTPDVRIEIPPARMTLLNELLVGLVRAQDRVEVATGETAEAIASIGSLLHRDMAS